jgi:hypothetical protein
LNKVEKMASRLNFQGFWLCSSSVQIGGVINLQKLENSKQMASSCVC